MRLLEKTARITAIALTVLLIVLSLSGIFGAWFVSRKASDVALKGFGVIEIGVGVVVQDQIGKSNPSSLLSQSRCFRPSDLGLPLPVTAEQQRSIDLAKCI